MTLILADPTELQPSPAEPEVPSLTTP
jgi:hypothetical protein